MCVCVCVCVLVALLRKTLTKCKMLGWMDQITGTGLNGTYRLAFPYYPRYIEPLVHRTTSPGT